MLETVMFTSVTRRPTRLSTLLATLRRTASASCGIDLPYSAVSVRSMAASSWPTSTETPWVWLPPLPPVMLPRMPLTAWEPPLPILMPSTSWEAMPAIFDTTLSEMLVEPRSVWSGLWDLSSLMLLLSSPRSPLRRPACDQPVNREQDYRAEGPHEDGREADAGYLGPPEQPLDHETPDERPHDTDQDRDNDPPGIGPRHDPLGQRAGYEPDHYQRHDAYALSPPPSTHFLLPPDGTRKRNITDAVPEATFTRLTPSPPRINNRANSYLRSSSAEQILQRGPHEGEREEHGCDVEKRMNLAGLASGELDQHVRDEPETYSVRDVEGERQRQYGQKGGDGLVKPVPRDVPDLGHHQEPDDYQGGGRHGREEQGTASSRRVRYRDRAAEHGDEGREREGDQEEETDDHAAQARPPSFRAPRPALYVAGHRARA